MVETVAVAEQCVVVVSYERSARRPPRSWTRVARSLRDQAPRYRALRRV